MADKKNTYEGMFLISPAVTAEAALVPSGRSRGAAKVWLGLTSVLGFAGVAFHCYGVSRAAGVLTGAVIGTCIGLLVARLGIPSFVVTLAAFLGLQGVLLKLIGEGGTIPMRDETLLGLNNDTLPVWLGWTLYAAVVLAYVLYNVVYAASALPAGIVSDIAGRRNVILAGFAIFAAVYLGFAMVENTLGYAVPSDANPP